MLDFVVLRIESVIWCILNWFVDSYLYVKWTLARFDVDKCVKTSPVPLQHPILIIAQTVHFMRALCSCDISIRRNGWRNEQLIQQTEINDDFTNLCLINKTLYTICLIFDHQVRYNSDVFFIISYIHINIITYYKFFHFCQ